MKIVYSTCISINLQFGFAMHIKNVAWGSSHHWAEIFSAFKSFSLCIVKIVTPCSTGFGLLAGPWWDSVTEKKKTIS